MIDLKPPEKKPVNLFYQQLEEESCKDFESSWKVSGNSNESEEINKILNPDAYYLKEISKTLKEMLREMRKRK